MNMNMPRFTAEASLYWSNRHYRTGRNALPFTRPMISPIYPSIGKGELGTEPGEPGEVIRVHGCAPGWTDIGGSCWPDPITEPPSTPPSTPPGTPRDDGPVDEREGPHVPGGESGVPREGEPSSKKPPKPYMCTIDDFGSYMDFVDANHRCENAFHSYNAYLWCKPSGGGGPTKISCCYKYTSGKKRGKTACTGLSSLPD
jgi:hypothetical protein